ncbi:glutamate-rich protein 3-like [Athene noctua]|uniref:glutamate-rich protein 3-like n=1 Tax=Athene noctua TaxID=126797 RepID=UPI003EB8A435
MVLEGLAGERAKEEEANSEEVLSSEEEACSEEEEGVVISGGDQGGGGGGEQDQGHGEQGRDMAAGATSSSQAWPEPDPDPTGSSAELPLAVPGALALRPEPLATVISGSGRILPEKECQLNTIEEEHLRYTREGLAGTVFRKALGIETSRRPHAAPGDLQHSLHFPPLPICAAVGAVNTSTSKKKCLAPQLSLQPASREERSEVKGPNAVKYMTSLSPVVNTGLIPAPPPPQQKRGNTVRSEVTRGRKLCPVSVPTEAEHPPRKNSGVVSRSLVRSGARVTVALVGKNLCLPGKAAGDRQHCGGENLCMYKGRLLEGEYDDDIEAEERQIDDQMSGTSESPSGDEKPDLDTEKESETLSEKALEVSDSEKDEDDKYSDSDFWDDEQG